MEVSKTQTNDIDTSSLKSQENGPVIRSSSENIKQQLQSNGSVVFNEQEQTNGTIEIQTLASNNIETVNQGPDPVGPNTNGDISGSKDNDVDEDDSDSSSSSSSSDESEIEVERMKDVKHDDEIISEAATPSTTERLFGSNSKESNEEEPNKVKELEKKLEEAWSKCDEAQKEAKSFENQKKEVEEKLSYAEEKNRNVSATSENLKRLNEELQVSLNEKNLELRNNSSELEQLETTIKELRKEIAQMQSSEDSMNTDLQSSRQDLSKAVVALESKEEATQELEENFKNLKSKADEQEHKLGELKDRLEMAKNEMETEGNDKTEVESQLREELSSIKAIIRSTNQANSKLEARLSNSQTIIDTKEVECQKLKEEVKSLKDKIKWIERRSEKDTSPRSETSVREEQLGKKMKQESSRRMQERVRDLEQKVIQVNDEKKKIHHEYEEAVKALEAVDKVYSVREMALQQYKTELDDANVLVKQQSSEIQDLNIEMNQMKDELRKAEEEKVERDEQKGELIRLKEKISIYKDEIAEVRRELSDQVHELQIAQAKAREKGKKIQILELELTEIQESLTIAKNVIHEKENNMKSLRESLQNEKKNCKTLQQELEEHFYLKKKLELIEDEKARIIGKLGETEADLKETQETHKKYCSKNKELDKELDVLCEEQEKLKNKCQDQSYQITTLLEVVESKEGDIEQQLIELIHTREQLDELTNQLQEMWVSYSADKAYWKNRTGKSIRRSKSAPQKKILQTAAPSYQSLPQSQSHSLSHKRLVNKLGLPLVNPEYISTKHKSIPLSSTQQSETKTMNNEPAENNPKSVKEMKESPTKLSPRPPADSMDKTKPQRPPSSYGISTYPPMNGELHGYRNESKAEDVWMHVDGGSCTSADTDEQIVQYLVNKGDRVMIQSKVTGDEKLNVSGVVKYVGKVGKKTSSPVYVGLKLDQPFGDNNGAVKGRQFFKCQPNHGKLVKLSEVQAVMHPRTQNYRKIKPMTVNW